MTSKEWNEKYPKGTRVSYHPILSSKDLPIFTKTRSESWELGHGEPVVLIEGISGGVLLSHLNVLGELKGL